MKKITKIGWLLAISYLVIEAILANWILGGNWHDDGDANSFMILSLVLAFLFFLSIVTFGLRRRSV